MEQTALEQALDQLEQAVATVRARRLASTEAAPMRPAPPPMRLRAA